MTDKFKKFENFRAFGWTSVIFVHPRMTSQQKLRMRIETIDGSRDYKMATCPFLDRFAVISCTIPVKSSIYHQNI